MNPTVFNILQNVKIGGHGHTVAIDETLVSKGKYHVGRLVKEQWVFGGYDIQTKLGFLVPVAKRDRRTLESVIKSTYSLKLLSYRTCGDHTTA